MSHLARTIYARLGPFRPLARGLYRRLSPLPPLPARREVNKLDFRSTYVSHVHGLEESHGHAEAMELAVGGEFEGIGLLELEILKHFGLRADDYLIDAGCGSGRLARPLSGYLTGRYLGIDVVPALLGHARQIVNRPDWRFEVAPGLTIPEVADAADMVCFFSVFTHLLHEHSYLYLRDARRVLKPGGRIVFSFLDFTMPEHWAVFEGNLADVGVNAQHLNAFISKDAIAVWANRLEMELETIRDANDPFIPLSVPIRFGDGRTMVGRGTLGQSVCVLRKRAGVTADRPAESTQPLL